MKNISHPTSSPATCIIEVANQDTNHRMSNISAVVDSQPVTGDDVTTQKTLSSADYYIIKVDSRKFYYPKAKFTEINGGLMLSNDKHECPFCCCVGQMVVRPTSHACETCDEAIFEYYHEYDEIVTDSKKYTKNLSSINPLATRRATVKHLYKCIDELYARIERTKFMRGYIKRGDYRNLDVFEIFVKNSESTLSNITLKNDLLERFENHLVREYQLRTAIKFLERVLDRTCFYNDKKIEMLRKLGDSKEIADEIVKLSNVNKVNLRECKKLARVYENLTQRQPYKCASWAMENIFNVSGSNFDAMYDNDVKSEEKIEKKIRIDAKNLAASTKYCKDYNEFSGYQKQMNKLFAIERSKKKVTKVVQIAQPNPIPNYSGDCPWMEYGGWDEAKGKWVYRENKK